MQTVTPDEPIAFGGTSGDSGDHVTRCLYKQSAASVNIIDKHQQLTSATCTQRTELPSVCVEHDTSHVTTSVIIVNILQTLHSRHVSFNVCKVLS